MLRLTLAACLISTAALAQTPVCAPREQMLDVLADRYGETPTGYGLSNRGVMAEITANRETGGWTLVLTGPDGLSCIADAGQMWAVAPSGDPA